MREVVVNPKYAFISACLKGEEARTVSPGHIDRVVTASNLQDALAVIRDTDIGGYLEGLPVKTFDNVDEYLWNYLAQHIEYVESFKLLPKELLNLSRGYVVKYDVSNIKAALQSIASGKKPRMIPIGILHKSGLLDRLSGVDNVDDIAVLLNRCRLGDYVPPLEPYKKDKDTKTRLLVEAKLDGQYYNSMVQTARRLKDGFVLRQALGVLID
ncbi:MAG: V-type ATPase subunit, partial [Candidatus Bathyarchaeia archaeon]